MKCLALSLFLLVAAQAQSTVPTQVEIEAVKFGWRKLPRGERPSAAKDQQMRLAQIDALLSAEYRKDPLDQDRGMIARLQEERERLRRYRPIEPDSMRQAAGKGYEYKFTFKNHGDKEVAALTWVYIFIDSATGHEVGRLEFSSKVTLPPGKERGVTAYSDSSPPMVVNVGSVKKEGKAWKELVTVESVQFSDGSTAQSSR